MAKKVSGWIVTDGKMAIGQSCGRFAQVSPASELTFRFLRKEDAENFIMCMYTLGQNFIKSFRADEKLWE